MVIQSTHLLKECYRHMVSDPHCSEILPPKELDYMCMTWHPARGGVAEKVKVKFQVKLQKAKCMRISGKKKFSGSKTYICLRKLDKYVGDSSLRDNSLNRTEAKFKMMEFVTDSCLPCSGTFN